MRERDVPGRQPNVAERAGVMEDYILTSAKVIKGSAPQSTTGAAAGTAATGTTAGTGTATGTTGTTGQRTPDATRAAGQPTTGTDAARTGAATAGASAAGMQPMFDVKNLDDDRLKPLVGKRVQIDGTFADVSRSQPAGSTEDLVDIQGSTIREVAGQCPAPKQ